MDTAPIPPLETRFSDLSKMIEDFVRKYVAQWKRVLPSAHLQFLDLTTIPGRMVGEMSMNTEKRSESRVQLFAARIWRILQAKVFHRYSTFWAREDGKYFMIQLDSKKDAYVNEYGLRAWHCNRSEAIKDHFSAYLVFHASCSDEVRYLSMVIFRELQKFYNFDNLFLESRIKISDVMDKLVELVCSARDIDLDIRRSELEYEIGNVVDIGIVGRTEKLDDSAISAMEVVSWRQPDDNVVLKVSPPLLSRGAVDEQNNQEHSFDDCMRVVVKCGVVVGQGLKLEDKEYKWAQRSSIRRARRGDPDLAIC